MRIRRGWLPRGLLAPLLLVLTGCAPQPGSAPAAADPTPPTFNKQIGRILQRDCQECHRPQGGSVSLVTFADAYRRRVKMAEQVDARQMPLWKPVAGHGDFVGARRLSAGRYRSHSPLGGGRRARGRSRGPAAAARLR